MREIKVRVWDKTTNYMDQRVRLSHFEDVVEVLDSWKNWRELKKGEYELTQYIGLNDFTGTNIYEGDIVRRDFEIYQTESSGSLENDSLEVWTETIAEGYFIGVVHQTPRGLFVLNNCKKYDAEGNFIKKCSGIQLHARHCRVIGNVFENSELLEEKA